VGGQSESINPLVRKKTVLGKEPWYETLNWKLPHAPAEEHWEEKCKKSSAAAGCSTFGCRKVWGLSPAEATTHFKKGRRDLAAETRPARRFGHRKKGKEGKASGGGKRGSDLESLYETCRRARAWNGSPGPHKPPPLLLREGPPNLQWFRRAMAASMVTKTYGRNKTRNVSPQEKSLSGASQKKKVNGGSPSVGVALPATFCCTREDLPHLVGKNDTPGKKSKEKYFPFVGGERRKGLHLLDLRGQTKKTAGNECQPSSNGAGGGTEWWTTPFGGPSHRYCGRKRHGGCKRNRINEKGQIVSKG